MSVNVEFAPVVEDEVTGFNGAAKGLFKRALEVDGVVKGLHKVSQAHQSWEGAGGIFSDKSY